MPLLSDVAPLGAIGSWLFPKPSNAWEAIWYGMRLPLLIVVGQSCLTGVGFGLYWGVRRLVTIAKKLRRDP